MVYDFMVIFPILVLGHSYITSNIFFYWSNLCSWWSLCC